MTDEARPGAVAGTPDAVSWSAGRTRLIAAGVGAALGAVALAILWLVGSIVGGADIAILALVAGPDGILSATGGAPGIWIAPVAATALSGAFVAVRAARRRPWSGAVMGFVAYALGIVLGSLLVAVLLGTTTDPADAIGYGPGQAVGAALLFIPFGAIVAAPLLAVCVVVGVVWAAILRAVVPAPAMTDPAEADAGSRSTGLAVALVVVGGALGLLWLIAMWFLELLAATEPGG